MCGCGPLRPGGFREAERCTENRDASLRTTSVSVCRPRRLRRLRQPSHLSVQRRHHPAPHIGKCQNRTSARVSLCYFKDTRSPLLSPAPSTLRQSIKSHSQSRAWPLPRLSEHVAPSLHGHVARSATCLVLAGIDIDGLAFMPLQRHPVASAHATEALVNYIG